MEKLGPCKMPTYFNFLFLSVGLKRYLPICDMYKTKLTALYLRARKLRPLRLTVGWMTPLQGPRVGLGAETTELRWRHDCMVKLCWGCQR